MPPVSHPFQKGLLVVLMNYNDHAPPHVHVKYQNVTAAIALKSNLGAGCSLVNSYPQS
ncbi:MAG: DUF4160 domain-containing protein [Nodosilinea sp. WJT8-NPBG4]|nr:DUF4160 domain-containing protein [Nodosilinea sp. WJT8-NPBG4]